jgi:hypothetical protein
LPVAPFQIADSSFPALPTFPYRLHGDEGIIRFMAYKLKTAPMPPKAKTLNDMILSEEIKKLLSGN